MDCCQCVKPRYKRLVDNIYPRNPQEGLVSSNMSKLQYYALQSSPNKLDRIGEYLQSLIETDLRHNRDYRVYISMDALDNLLSACHSRTLNLFATSFLSIIQLLLECNKVNLQARATKSFIQFCNIQEESPTHHFRRYEFFINLFCSLSFTAPGDKKPVLQRISGLQGLQGIVRKTVDEDVARFQLLTEQNLNSMVPALLMNIERENDEEDAEQIIELQNSEKTKFLSCDETPASLAESCLRDLLQKTSGGHNLEKMLTPMLAYLDQNEWNNLHFSTKCINLIFTSINPDYTFAAITFLLDHISKLQTSPEVKIEIVTQLKDAVNIAKPTNIGTLIYQVFDKILGYLKQSITQQIIINQREGRKSGSGMATVVSAGTRIASAHRTGDLYSLDDESDQNEQKYQSALLEVMGSILLNVEDVQKLVIFSFLFKKITSMAGGGPPRDDDDSCSMGSEVKSDKRMQTIILKSIKRVAQEYNTMNYCDTFKPSLNEHLQMWSINEDETVRLLMQQILHRLIDRHGNAPHLKRIDLFSNLEEFTLLTGHPPKSDLNFMKSSGQMFLQVVYETCFQSNNTEENYHALFTTLCLLCIEVGQEEALVDILKLLFGLQELVNGDTHELSPENVECVNCLVLCVFNFIGKLHIFTFPNLDRYVTRVVYQMGKNGCPVLPYLVPKLKISPPRDMGSEASGQNKCLFSQSQVEQALGFTSEKKKITQFVPNRDLIPTRKMSTMTEALRRPSGAIEDINLEFDQSDSGSRGGSQDSLSSSAHQEVTPATLKSILNNTNLHAQEEEKIRKEMIDKYKNQTLRQIANEMARKNEEMTNARREIWERIENSPAKVTNTYGVPPELLARSLKCEPENTLEMTFPPGYLY